MNDKILLAKIAISILDAALDGVVTDVLWMSGSNETVIEAIFGQLDLECDGDYVEMSDILRAYVSKGGK